MRPDIEEYLREQGWVFAGVSQPDHKRQWAQVEDGRTKRVVLESELEDLALEIVGNIANTSVTAKEKQYAPKRYNLYENGVFIDSFLSHAEAKKAKHRKTVEARKDMLDLVYTIKPA